MAEPSFNQTAEAIVHACSVCDEPQLAFVPSERVLNEKTRWNYLHCMRCARPTQHWWRNGAQHG